MRLMGLIAGIKTDVIARSCHCEEPSLRGAVIARSEATKQTDEAIFVIAKGEALKQSIVVKQSIALRRRLGLASMLAQRRLRPTCDTRRCIASLLD